MSCNTIIKPYFIYSVKAIVVNFYIDTYEYLSSPKLNIVNICTQFNIKYLNRVICRYVDLPYICECILYDHLDL